MRAMVRRMRGWMSVEAAHIRCVGVGIARGGKEGR